MEEPALLELLRCALERWQEKLRGPALPLVTMLLQEESLPYKGNLLTRVHDVDELHAELEMAVYTRISNPLLATPAAGTEVVREAARELRHDVA